MCEGNKKGSCFAVNRRVYGRGNARTGSGKIRGPQGGREGQKGHSRLKETLSMLGHKAEWGSQESGGTLVSSYTSGQGPNAGLPSLCKGVDRAVGSHCLFWRSMMW